MFCGGISLSYPPAYLCLSLRLELALAASLVTTIWASLKGTSAPAVSAQNTKPMKAPWMARLKGRL